MSYRKEDIPGMISILAIAKTKLNGNIGVCLALSFSYIDRSCADYDSYRLATSLVNESLGEFSWLSSWLKEKGTPARSDKELLELRHLWIDKMISDLRRYAQE